MSGDKEMLCRAPRGAISPEAMKGIAPSFLEAKDNRYEAIISLGKELDTYRELCGELLKCLVDAQNTLAHCKAGVGYQQRQTDTAIKVNSAIAKAEKVLGGKNGTSN